MKPTRNVNIGSIPFVIDEDAFVVLEDYLRQVSNRLPVGERAEILEDVENRIAEIFAGRINPRMQVISLPLVGEAIAIMGAAEEFGEAQTFSDYFNSTKPTIEKSWCGFYRSVDDRVLGGVCGGLAKVVNIDPKALRILYAVLTIVSFSALMWIYLAAWILVPEETIKK